MDETPAGHSEDLTRLAAAVEAEAERLIGLPDFDRDYDLGRVARSLGLWSMAIARLAESGPAALRSIERGFRDHPEFRRPDPDPWASHRAMLDVVGFLSAGDMLLDDFAAFQLTRWSLDPGGGPWRKLTTTLDAGEPRGSGLRPAVRYLDLVLREARARIVAHRSRRHALSTSWDLNGAFRVTMIGMAERDAAQSELAAVLEAAGAPAWPTRPPGPDRQAVRRDGTSSTLRILPDGAWAFLARPAGQIELFLEPNQIRAKLHVMTKSPEGRWQVWGPPEQADVLAARFVQLPL